VGHAMTAATPTREYLADRYDRLRNSCEWIASDTGMVETDSIFGADGLRGFTQSLTDARLLDGLSEHDANTVAMLVTLDFPRGPAHMAWRIRDWLNPDGNSVGREDDNTPAVATVLTLSLGLVLSAFAGPEFAEASTAVRMFEKPGDELDGLTP
jgi:hypothetical protein